MFRLVLGIGTVYTHFMYVPITLACMWWGSRGIAVAGALALMLLLFHLFGVASEAIWSDVARGGFFLLIALFVGMLRDRLAAGQKALSEAEESSRMLVEKSLTGIVVHRDGRILFANDRFCRIVGLPSGAATGLSLDDFLPPEDQEGFRLLADPTGREPGSDSYRESRIKGKDGTTVWVEVAASRFVYHGEDAVLANLNSISERKEGEDKRKELSDLARRQEEQLEHSTRLAELGEMAAAISHELNQPLTGIRNYARNAFYMIEKRLGGDEDVKGNLRLISEQVDRASKIINQMRELTKRTDRSFTALDVNSVIRESLDFLIPQMRLSEVEVELSLSPDLPQIWGDRIRLAQVFLNLLTNARQAMEGSAERRLVISSRPDDGSEALPVVVEVRDTGKGFSEEEARRLFQPFYTTRKTGHGLGLSISRAIIKDHKGVIEASGAAGRGATFAIRLPAAQHEGGEGSA